MDTKYIGTGQDFENIDQACDYVDGLGTLTQDVEIIHTDDKIYTVTDKECTAFTNLTFGAFQLRIGVDPSVFHGGIFGTGARYEKNTSLYLFKLVGDGDDSFIFEDLSVLNTATGSAWGCIGAIDGTTIERIIAKSTATGGSIISFATALGAKANACLSIGVTHSTFGFKFSEFTPAGGYYKNLTARGCNRGFWNAQSNAPNTTKNLVAYDNTTDFDDTGGSGWGDSSNNASEDGT
ncbi:MAG: hypothetical protein GY819_03720, partial [Planctomycetaceae bacterium]|nr:hypothetical protein [Planctomycetaceae bacterium]